MSSEALTKSDGLDLTPEARRALGRVYSLLLRLAAARDDQESSVGDHQVAEVRSEDEGVQDDPA